MIHKESEVVMPKLLYGCALDSRIETLVKENFSTDNTPVRKKNVGRPYSRRIDQVANDYLSSLPQDMVYELAERPDLICRLMTTLAENRRDLTEEEAEYIANSRDIKAMGELDGEPAQLDYFNRFTVARKKGETLGQACFKRYRQIRDFAQAEANRSNTTLYVILERYSLERNWRDKLTAQKYNAPLSGVGLMSKNVATIIVTDNLKDYKGSIGTMAVLTPSVPAVKTKRTFKQPVKKNVENPLDIFTAV